MADKFGGQPRWRLQEVRDPRTNKVLFLVDDRGKRWAPDGKPMSEAQAKKATGVAESFREQQDREKQEEIQRTTPAAGRQMWLDGQFVTVVEDAQGRWTVSQKGVDGSQAVTPPTAFSALDSAIDPTSPFLISRQEVGLADAQGPRRPSIYGDTYQPGRNMLTIEGAVQWLAELSTKDPGAYAAMLDKFVSAGYMTVKDRKAAAGKWSAAAGAAIAQAGRDVAVLNTTKGGLNTTLDQLLAEKAAAGAGEASGDFEPVTRSFTDPEYLKAAARGAAEDALGRRLTDEEEAKLTARFRGMENAAFDTQDAARRSGEGGSYVDPNPAGQVAAFVEDGPLEQEAANWRTAEYGQALKRLFGVPTGG